MSKISISDGCWLWKGSRGERYGRFNVGGKKYQAHRFSYFVFNGYMPKSDEYVCHKCDNTFCVNPEHLFLGTQQDNMNDMVSKGRSPNNKGHRNPRATLTDLDVFEIRRLYSLGILRKNIAKMFRSTKSTINNIVGGFTWQHLEYKKPNIKPSNKKLTVDISDKIKELRATTNLSQDKIGEACGISQAVVSRVLLGQARAWFA